MIARHPQSPPISPRSVRRGFTIIEVMIVVTIISVLAALALPAFKRITISSQGAATANDLRVFGTAFQTYAQQNSNYPPNAGIGVLPPLMAGALNRTAWQRITPIRGRYKWNYNTVHAGTRYRASISLRSQGTNRVSNDQNQLLAVDRALDDGNLTTGSFFIGAGNEPVYIIER